MATKLRAQVTTSGPAAKGGAQTFEEVFVRNDVVSLCLLLNRRSRTMRVIDFRAGASPAKKLFVQSIARREQFLPAPVVDGEREHALELLDTGRPELLVGMENGFRVAVRSEAVPS